MTAQVQAFFNFLFVFWSVHGSTKSDLITHTPLHLHPHHFSHPTVSETAHRNKHATDHYEVLTCSVVNNPTSSVGSARLLLHCCLLQQEVVEQHCLSKLKHQHETQTHSFVLLPCNDREVPGQIIGLNITCLDIWRPSEYIFVYCTCVPVTHVNNRVMSYMMGPHANTMCHRFDLLLPFGSFYSESIKHCCIPGVSNSVWGFWFGKILKNDEENKNDGQSVQNDNLVFIYNARI